MRRTEDWWDVFAWVGSELLVVDEGLISVGSGADGSVDAGVLAADEDSILGVKVLRLEVV
jgi:hypothetical protein